MSRQIKFRAWSEKWKRMVYHGVDNFTIDVLSNTAWFDAVDDECIILMQFTGLQDKNKKDIYEGDIVECCRYESNDLYIVQVKDIRYLPSELFGSNLNYREVIGNIHEHPDLLNQGNQAKVKSLK